MKYEDFRQDRRQAAVAETLDIIEGQLLPSIIQMIAAAASDQRTEGRRASELRSLAGDLERLTALVENPARTQRLTPSRSNTDAK